MKIELGKNSHFFVEITILTRPPIYLLRPRAADDDCQLRLFRKATMPQSNSTTTKPVFTVKFSQGPTVGRATLQREAHHGSGAHPTIGIFLIITNTQGRLKILTFLVTLFSTLFLQYSFYFFRRVVPFSIF